MRVSVEFHKDGDHVVISKAPWWLPIPEFFVHRITPCCGVAGFLSKWDWWLASWLYSVGNRLTMALDRFEKELYRVPVEHGCVASQAIFGGEQLCWLDDCPVHPSEPETT